MNRCFLKGRLGNDAELKVTQGGQALTKFSLATSEKFKDKSGNLQEKTQWHRCVLWGPRAEKITQYLLKGTELIVEGSIEYGSYEKDGEKRYTTDIKVFNVEFCGGKKNGDSGNAPSNDDTVSDEAANAGAPTGDDEIPF